MCEGRRILSVANRVRKGMVHPDHRAAIPSGLSGLKPPHTLPLMGGPSEEHDPSEGKKIAAFAHGRRARPPSAPRTGPPHA